jgi:hypothetical protein
MSDAPPPLPPVPHIGTLNEKPLHEALKRWLAAPGDRCEARVGRYVVDIVRDDEWIEIQTRHFAALRVKLARLLAREDDSDSGSRHTLRLVYPLPVEKWIVRLDADGVTPLSRRRSPKRGALVDVFAELVHVPTLLAHPRFVLDVLCIQEEEARRFDGRRGWRRKGWVTHERRLIAVLDRHTFAAPADLLALLPDDLPALFTTAELAAGLGRSRRLAQQMVYTLRALDVIAVEGKRGRAVLYRAVEG